MKLCRFTPIFGFLFVASTTSAKAQDYADVDGNCNVTIQGSGNIVQEIRCPNGSTQSDGSALVVLTPDNYPPFLISYIDINGLSQPFYFPQNSIDVSSSYHTIEFRDTLFEQDLTSPFDGGYLDLPIGRHPYMMRLDLVAWNGQNASVSCRGIADVQTNATLHPRFQIYVNLQTGALQSGGCWFIASDS
jgi:hypothetical protein